MPSLLIVRGCVSLLKGWGSSGWRPTCTDESHITPETGAAQSAPSLPYFYTWTCIPLKLLLSSFHKPLLKIYYVKFVGRVFMKGRVFLSKGVSVFIIWLPIICPHNLSVLFQGGLSPPRHEEDSLGNSPSIGVVLALPRTSPSEQQTHPTVILNPGIAMYLAHYKHVLYL